MYMRLWNFVCLWIREKYFTFLVLFWRISCFNNARGFQLVYTGVWNSGCRWQCLLRLTNFWMWRRALLCKFTDAWDMFCFPHVQVRRGLYLEDGVWTILRKRLRIFFYEVCTALRKKKRYCNLKKEALDRSMWRIRFGRGCGLVRKEDYVIIFFFSFFTMSLSLIETN
jgi:hypothetical protein